MYVLQRDSKRLCRSRSRKKAASQPRCPSSLQQGCLLLVAPLPQHPGTGECKAPDRDLGESAEADPGFSGFFHGNAAAVGRFACIYVLLSNYDRVFRTRTVSPCPELRAEPEREREGQPLRSGRVSAPGRSRERPGRGRHVLPASSLPWRPALTPGPHRLPAGGTPAARRRRRGRCRGPPTRGGLPRDGTGPGLCGPWTSPISAAGGLMGRERGEGCRAQAPLLPAPGPSPHSALHSFPEMLKDPISTLATKPIGSRLPGLAQYSVLSTQGLIGQQYLVHSRYVCIC